MTTGLADMEDGVENPFGKVTIEEIPLETNLEDEDLPAFEMLIGC